jgi:hypothetical protein
LTPSPPAFPPSRLRGIKPLPKNWEAGKAGGQETGFIQQSLALMATRRLKNALIVSIHSNYNKYVDLILFII